MTPRTTAVLSEDDNYRLLFGPYAEAMAKAFPGGPPLLGRADRHRLLAVLDGGGAAEAPDDPGAFRAAYGGEFALVRPVFRRLTAPPLPRGGYRSLVPRLLAEPKLTRALTQMQSLSRRRVAVATALPPELARAKFIASVPSPRAARDFAAVFGKVALRSGRSRTDLAAALLRCKAWNEVWAKLRSAVTPETLPPAPWPGDDRLRPVEAVSEVRALGQRFRNCMVRMAEDWARDGDTVIYVYEGPSPAVVSLEKDRWLGWRIDDIKGPENARVPPAALRDIRARFAAQGITEEDVRRRIRIGDW